MVSSTLVNALIKQVFEPEIKKFLDANPEAKLPDTLGKSRRALKRSLIIAIRKNTFGLGDLVVDWGREAGGSGQLAKVSRAVIDRVLELWKGSKHEQWSKALAALLSKAVPGAGAVPMEDVDVAPAPPPPLTEAQMADRAFAQASAAVDRELPLPAATNAADSDPLIEGAKTVAAVVQVGGAGVAALRAVWAAKDLPGKVLEWLSAVAAKTGVGAVLAGEVISRVFGGLGSTSLQFTPEMAEAAQQMVDALTGATFQDFLESVGVPAPLAALGSGLVLAAAYSTLFSAKPDDASVKAGAKESVEAVSKKIQDIEDAPKAVQESFLGKRALESKKRHSKRQSAAQLEFDTARNSFLAAQSEAKKDPSNKALRDKMIDARKVLRDKFGATKQLGVEVPDTPGFVTSPDEAAPQPPPAKKQRTTEAPGFITEEEIKENKAFTQDVRDATGKALGQEERIASFKALKSTVLPSEEARTRQKNVIVPGVDILDSTIDADDAFDLAVGSSFMIPMSVRAEIENNPLLAEQIMNETLRFHNSGMEEFNGQMNSILQGNAHLPKKQGPLPPMNFQKGDSELLPFHPNVTLGMISQAARLTSVLPDDPQDADLVRSVLYGLQP